MMKILKKIIVLALLNLTINVFAQKELKKLVYDDLFLVNEIYNYQLFDTNSIVLTISKSDSIREEFSYAQLQMRVEENVNVTNIDTSGSFFLFEASFNNINFNCYPTISNKKLNLKYLVYQSNDRYYKINGFLSSDVLLLESDEFFAMNYFENYLDTKKLEKSLKKSNKKKLSTFLYSNILKVYNSEVDSKINFRPIFISPKLKDCEVIE